MQPVCESGFPGTSPVRPAIRSPSIQFLSNVVVGDGDAVAASLSACPSTSSSRGSSSDIEIQVLFQGNDDYYAYDDDYSTMTTSPAAVWSRSTSFHGCSDGELDMEAGRSRLLRAQSLRSMEEFIERDSTGELRWNALEGGGLQFASRSRRSNAG
jgi:hypothetical protein